MPPELLCLRVEAVEVARPGYELWRPNREKAESKTMKAVVAFVLLVSGGAADRSITIGGWDAAREPERRRDDARSGRRSTCLRDPRHAWNRGILPVAAALAMILAIFAAIAAPDWFARDKAGPRLGPRFPRTCSACSP